MIEAELVNPELLLAYAAYVVATASPGPATLGIMNIAMKQGRQPALVFCAGVLTGSLFWAIVATLGVASVIAANARWLSAIRILGALYLFWLAYKAARSAWHGRKVSLSQASRGRLVGASVGWINEYAAYYRQGLLLHLTNPKAVLAWVAIVALVMPEHPSATQSMALVTGCFLLGALVFGGYAILFSTATMRFCYQRLGRWFEALVAVVFATAGCKLLTRYW